MTDFSILKFQSNVFPSYHFDFQLNRCESSSPGFMWHKKIHINKLTQRHEQHQSVKLCSCREAQLVPIHSNAEKRLPVTHWLPDLCAAVLSANQTSSQVRRSCRKETEDKPMKTDVFVCLGKPHRKHHICTEGFVFGGERSPPGCGHTSGPSSITSCPIRRWPRSTCPSSGESAGRWPW